uniref:Retinoic acid induced 1 n=1 Tax=Poecilia formosa TaxID=48698 RepID=A0A096M139_POEFO
MQSFRERNSGYHSNQPCYQQEPHELSRLETYRQHPHHPHPQHPHPGGAAGIGGPKDCYSQPNYSGYPGSTGAKKSFRGSKVPPPNPSQHLQGPGGYSNHMGPGNYSTQYMSESHLQQKWEDPAQLAQYEQEMVGRLEAGASPAPGSSQYIDSNMLGHSQTPCHQPSTPSYTSPHHQPHPPNPAPSPLMYPQSHLHYPQPSPSPSPYMEKCSPMPHCYKGYNIPPNSQYSRQLSSHSSLKQGTYRSTQNSYGYQQSTPRGYEQQTSLQAMTNPQEPHPKYQHYNQPQQNYCLSELPVRSPEQYYQTCSPSSSHSPARSVGRSPSYSSTPSPLMTNPESFQYGQPPMTPGAASSSSSSSAGMQDQASANTMLMPPRSHPSPNISHTASHSYTSTPQAPTMKERFSEKLLSNPSLWSLNALTSQVENISNNVQQLLLSEALVANKKGGKRSSAKKGEEYKSPPYPDSGGNVGGVPMHEPYSTPQHQPLPMELHEGGYSSSSDEPLDRGFYYFGQGRSPAQAHNNTQLSLDTASSCSIASPDDMSTRSGDSGLHNLTPDPIRCTAGQGGDGMNTPGKSIGDERSPTSITIPSPMKQESDSPSDIQHINQPVKENFEESAWTEKPAGKEEEAMDKTLDFISNSDSNNPTEKQEKWTDEEKCPNFYSKINTNMAEKGYCYEDTMYQEVQSKYDSDARDSVEQSPADLSDSSNKDHFSQEIKSEVFKSESPTASESSVKTLPFISRGDLEQDPYSTEKDDSSANTSPTPRTEVLEESSCDKKESRTQENDKDMDREEDEINEDEKEEIEKCSFSQLLSKEVREEEEEEEEKETLNTDTAATTATDVSTRESAIGDTAPQPQSAMPVFSALNDKAAPPAQARDHIDHSDAKVLEPDSPQLPGKSILPSAPSWADTPPSPQKGDDDIEPGISCSSAVTPLAKPEPMVPSAQPRTYGRKHVRGRRRIIHSGVALRRQLSLKKEEQKLSMAPSKTVLFSDQTNLAHQDSMMSQTPKMLTEGFQSRMCTRSFNAPDIQTKVEPNVKRKPGPKPGPKTGSKPSAKPGPKPGAKPGLKAGPKPGPKPGKKTGQKPAPHESEVPLKIETVVRHKPGPKPGSKSGPKPALRPGPKPGLKPAEVLPPTEAAPIKAPVGRPRGSISKTKLMDREDPRQEVPEMQSRTRKALKHATLQYNQDGRSPTEEKQSLPEIKVQERENNNMVLRSRKPSQDKLTKEKERGGDISLKVKEVIVVKKLLTPNPDAMITTNVSLHSPVPLAKPVLSEESKEKTLSILKRSSSPDISTPPVKKKRGPKPKLRNLPSQSVLFEETLPARKDKSVRGPRRKKASLVSASTKDAPPNSSGSTNSDVPVVPPQCPTKTKVLPPRKGRGQKYEAMVQKITSPSSKKHFLATQQESSLINNTETLEFTKEEMKEQEEAMAMEDVTQQGGKHELSQEESAKDIVRPLVTKRKRWAMVESTDASVVALEADSLIITTPRLAKQRAIKNNHEMHLKQRRKKRKGEANLEETEKVDELITTETPEPVERIEEKVTTTESTKSTEPLPTNEDKFTETPQAISAELIQKPRRGRKPSANPTKQKRSQASMEHAPGKPVKIHKKPGPKPGMKDAIETSIVGPVVTVTEKQTEFISVKRIRRRPINRNSKLSFCPYVRINNSRDFSSWCAIVNKPEDAVVFQRRRKKGILRMRNPFTVAKAVPHTAAMQLGPLVNTNLSDMRLTCCLCGKPPNYKDLGDLCGPYYTEDSIPRKILTITHTQLFREDGSKTHGNDSNSSEEPGTSSKTEDRVNSEKEHHRHYRRLLRPERPCQEGGPRRVTLRERFRRMKQLQNLCTATSKDQEGNESIFQKLQMEAVAKEHWAHENCTIWTKGIIMVAGRLYGLKEAANKSAQTSCHKCQISGASLSCCWRGCSYKYHYICAKEIGCTFHEDDFSIKCPKHEDL